MTQPQGTMLDRLALKRRGWSKSLINGLLPGPDCTLGGGRQFWDLEAVEHLESIPEIRSKLDKNLKDQHEFAIGQVQQPCTCAGAGAITTALLQTWAVAVAMEANGGDQAAALQELSRYDCYDLDNAGKILYALARGKKTDAAALTIPQNLA